jgi:nucleotide-binding universal stress UspA family protein
MADPKKPYIIVVGVDFSEASELALQRAFELASEQPNAEVHLVNVVQTYGPQVTYDMPMDGGALTVLTIAEARKRFKEYADKALARFLERSNARGDVVVGGDVAPAGEVTLAGADAGDVAVAAAEGGDVKTAGAEPAIGNRTRPFSRVVAHVRFDAIADEIAQLAADLEADLVVVGTHGRRGLSRVLLGSSAEATVRLAPCPVLVVRPKSLPDPGPAIEPPCPLCVEARRESHGSEMWCQQHRERHGQRHTYHQGDRVGSDREMPLLFRQ